MTDVKRTRLLRRATAVAVLLAARSVAAGQPPPDAARNASAPKIGERLARQGDEIVVCGQLFHTTAPVVLWTDPGGYDAYRVERRFVPLAEASWEKTREAAVPHLESPNRYGIRLKRLTPEQAERVRGGGWDLDTLRGVVDQFVIHFDARGTARRCFQVLHDQRGLSVHFLLDLDGTIYQTLDLKERAWHATIANDRSVGIEIANVGAFPVADSGKADLPLRLWYTKGGDGSTAITIPGGLENSGQRNPDVMLRPSRDEPVVGTIQGRELVQYDFTPAQYTALVKLIATLCTLFPRITCDYPRDRAGQLIPHKLPQEDFDDFQGILGHFHVQSNKVDPGPAFQWDKVIEGARRLLAP
jgi:N-acetyl-anhydromuramyl-L-alanine amidase AmpD